MAKELVNFGFIAELGKIMKNTHQSDVLREMAILGYGNVAGESIEFRDTVLSTNIQSQICNDLLAAEDGSKLMRSIMWCLVNFLKGKLRPKIDVIKVICSTLS